jgi:cytochrome P450
MKRAFRAHTLMRKDGEAHKRERMAMAPAFNPKVIQGSWMPEYRRIAGEYLDRLPRGEVVDLHRALAAPYAARGLAVLLGNGGGQRRGNATLEPGPDRRRRQFRLAARAVRGLRPRQ